MEKSLEDQLYEAVIIEDQDTISQLILQGANPNKTAHHGKTCLGEAANLGHISTLKLLIDASRTTTTLSNKTCYSGPVRKRYIKSHKRKLKHDGSQDESFMKCKNINERTVKDFYIGHCETSRQKVDKNQGYFVYIHNEGSSSDESRVPSLKTPLSPLSLTPSPQADLEWDEEIGNTAPTTTEDETWSSMYKWYAAILECTGAAIASASAITNGIDQQDAFMRTALHYAVEQGHIGAVKLLLEAGCKVDAIAGDSLTPLHTAVIKNHIEIVKMLIMAGSQVNYKTHEKMTPLHFAASRGFTDVIKILVSNGAYLEARDTNDRTALYLAAGRGHTHVVAYLISVGANVNGEEIHGYTPLCEAVWQRYASVVEILLASGARVTHSHKLLHNAIIQRQDRIIKMLANHGGGINLHHDNGDTPLLLATRLSQPSIVLFLLQNGANVNSYNNITGANALHLAVENVDDPKEFEELLIILLDYKIDMNTIALTGDTALNRALLLQKDNAAVLLIRYGANVNACDLRSCGLDNLSIASRRRHFNIARMLIKAGHHRMLPDPFEVVPKTGTTENWVYCTCRQPLSLSDICRNKIRNMSKNKVIFRFISSLPLPVSLKKFLMMEDEGVQYFYQ